MQESDYVDLRVFGSCLRDFDNINNVKWQFFNLRDYPQGFPISQIGLWSACDVGWGSSWVEILSSILRCRAVPASSKGIREFESHRRWPGVRCMVCWQGATHGHPTHVHPMVAMVAHRALMAHSSPIVRVDQGFTLTELLVPEKSF